MKISKKAIALMIAAVMVIVSFGQNITTIVYADEISEDTEFSNEESNENISIDNEEAIGDDNVTVADETTTEAEETITVAEEIDIEADGTTEVFKALTEAEVSEEIIEDEETTEAEIVDSGTCGENIIWKLYNDGLLVISGEGEMENYDGNSPFNYNDNIISVKIEDGIMSIGDQIFINCYCLTSVTIPDSVTSIGEWAFECCDSLTSITIPDSVTSIGEGAFCNCSNLISITIPNGVTSIDDFVFSGCSLTSITIPDSVTSIGDDAFSYCNITSITIPDSVTSIGQWAFWSCESLTSITIPDSVTSIGERAFSSCDSLTSITVSTGNSTFDSRDNCNAIIETATDTLIAGCANTIIPDSVTSIGPSAFEDCSSLTGITIPDSVTNIGSFAFDGCNNLTSITIPDSVTSIGSYAFFGCSSITNIVIPDSVTRIGDHAFSGCSSLTSIIVSNGNSTFDSRDNCNAIIKTATNTLIVGCGNTDIPDSVTSIGESAFSNCGNLTSITIPDSVTSIGYYAFCYCRSLASITIPNSVTEIGNQVFLGCDSLTNITIPDSLTSIGNSAFGYCSSLTDVYYYGDETDRENISIEDGNDYLLNAEWHYLKEADNETENYYLNFNELRLSLGVRRACMYFNGPDGEEIDGVWTSSDPNVASIEVTSDASWAWIEGLKIGSTTITYTSHDGVHSDTCLVTVVQGLNYKELTLTVGDPEVQLTFTGADNTPVTDAYWISYNPDVATVNEGLVTPVSEGEAVIWCDCGDPNIDFDYCRVTVVRKDASGDASGTCGENVTWTLDSDGLLVISGEGDMEDYSENGSPFYSNDNIKGIEIKDGVTSIGNEAFYSCHSITYISIPNSVTSIGEWAFYNCSSLASLAIPDGVKSIGDSAFIWCSSLTSITVSNGNTTFDSRDNCNAIIETATDTLIAGCANTIIPNSVKSIGDNAFVGRSGLTSITIPDSVTSIGEGAFVQCRDLTSITIPDGVTSIESVSFYKCTSLTSITIPNSVTSIRSHAFHGCSSLTSIIIPDSVTSIEEGAFYECSNLTSITIPDGVASIEDYVFYNCSSLTSITIPNSVTGIGNYAFYGCNSLTDVYYYGDEADIGNISIGQNNDSLQNAEWHYLGRSISAAGIVLSKTSYTYSGSARKPAVTVTLDGNELTKGTDYTVSYSNNIDAGTATVTVTGKGNYTGTATAEFTISPKDLAAAEIGLSNTSYTYSGSAKKPATTVSLGGAELTKGTDYTVAYSNNTDVGTGTVTITGKGNYTGTATAEFTINAKSLSAADIALSNTSYTYSGSAKKPATTVTLGSKKLTKGTDYIVTYSNNTNAGTGTVKITGTGNYKGTAKTTFTIAAKAVTPTVTLSATSYTYDGTVKKPTVTVKAGSTTLTTSDYSVSYASGRKTPGAYTVTVTLKGNYSGKKVVTFKILPKKTTISSVTAVTNGFTVKWAKQATQTTGYQIQYSTTKDFSSGNKTVSITSTSTVSKKITGLSAGKTYYVRIRTFKTVDGTKYYSAWSASKSVKTK